MMPIGEFFFKINDLFSRKIPNGINERIKKYSFVLFSHVIMLGTYLLRYQRIVSKK